MSHRNHQDDIDTIEANEGIIVETIDDKGWRKS